MLRSKLLTPPGFNSLLGHNRLHLLADSLGEPPSRWNIVFLYADVNQVAMRACEDIVSRAPKNGEIIEYAVISVYNDNSWIPISIWIYANGNQGTNFFVNILNM
jgi:hypothetical protein